MSERVQGVGILLAGNGKRPRFNSVISRLDSAGRKCKRSCRCVCINNLISGRERKTMEKRKGAAVCAFIAVVCAVCAAENRTMDGSYNNLAHPEWCRAGAQLLRICEPEYADGY